MASPTHGSAVAIVLAAGAGRRVGADEPKAFLPIGGRPMLSVATGAAAASPAVRSIVVAAPEGWTERALACVRGCGVPVDVVVGGATRQQVVARRGAEKKRDVPGQDPRAEVAAGHPMPLPFVDLDLEVLPPPAAVPPGPDLGAGGDEPAGLIRDHQRQAAVGVTLGRAIHPGAAGRRRDQTE